MRKLLLTAGFAALALSACQSEPAPQYPDVTIYPARAVLTMESPGRRRYGREPNDGIFRRED